MSGWPDGSGLHVGGADYPTGPPEQWPTGGPGPYGGGPSWGAPPAGGPSWGGSPMPPTPPGGGAPERGPGGRTWPAVVVALVVIGVLALAITGVGLLATSDDGDEDTATDTTLDDGLDEPVVPPTSEPFMPTMPSLPGFDPGTGVDPTERARPLEEVLPELIAFVEETRGHEFATEPVVEAATDEEFLQALEESSDGEGLPGLEDTIAPVALGLLQPGYDLDRAVDDLAAVGVLGFYDPETQELLVKGDVITPFVQSVIVHELTHALDDQVYGLGGLEEMEERDDESAFGFLALVEGTASEVQGAFEEQMSEEDAAALEAEQLQLGFEQLPQGMTLPPYLLVRSQVPYISGERFVEGLVAADGMAAVDAAYEAPPTTSEQVLDPAVFAAGEGAVPLDPIEPPDGVEVEEQGAFGAADLRLLDVVGNPMAIIDPNLGLLDPVEGFGGGRFVAWTDGDLSCIALEAVGDDAAGRAAIAELLEAWAGYLPDAEVGSRVGGTGIDVITATSCA